MNNNHTNKQAAVQSRASRPREKEQAVCGLEAVKALVEHRPERISRLFFNKERSLEFGTICKYLAQHKRLYRLVEQDAELEKLSGSIHHQGVVAMIRAAEIPRLDRTVLETAAKERTHFVLLDRIGNANNLGAIIRSAAFFGITQIVLTEEDAAAHITPAAYRVAQGGMEFVSLYRVSSAAWFVKNCRGLVTVIACDHKAFHKIENISTLVTPDESLALVIGNEEFGISDDIKKAANHVVKIPGAGTVESLNAAQAATVFFAALRRI